MEAPVRKMFPIRRTFVLVYHITLVLAAKLVSSSITSVDSKQTLTWILSQTEHVRCDYLTSAIAILKCYLSVLQY